MANTKSAAKRSRQTVKRSLRKRSALNRLGTLQKVALSGDKADPNRVRALISAIDKAAKQGILHRNAARRRKASLQKFAAARRQVTAGDRPARVPCPFCARNTPEIGLAYPAGEYKFFPMIPALVLVLLAVVYRLTTGLMIHSGTTWLSEFAPASAIALCCAAYFPRNTSSRCR